MDAVCARFRAALLSGQSPGLEDYLRSGDGLDRAQLFAELLEAELDFTNGIADLDPEKYRGRFPEFSNLIDAAFHKFAPTTLDESCAMSGDDRTMRPARRCPLFSVVPSDALRERTTEQHFAAGEFLMRQGDIGDSLMAILDGTVEITTVDESGATHVIDRSRAGDIMGEMALLTSELRTASVRALDDVRVLRLSVQSFYTLANEYPDLRVILTDLVASRLEKSGRDALTEKVLHGHRILRQLGKGSMGTVYEAEDLIHNRRVALKMMSHRLVYSREANARFQREADVVQSLSHANIVRSHTSFGAFHTSFIAMEYCEGHTLHDLIAARGPLPEGLCRKILGGVAAALNYAHSKGIVHLDLKPMNIMVGENNVAKLMDFGLAELVSELRPAGGRISGTVRYMPPEQRAGAVRSCRADYFALGCVAWEMISGKPLFSDSMKAELLRDFSTWTPPEWSEARPGLSQEICVALGPALAVDPDNRNPDLATIASWCAD